MNNYNVVRTIINFVKKVVMKDRTGQMRHKKNGKTRFGKSAPEISSDSLKKTSTGLGHIIDTIKILPFTFYMILKFGGIFLFTIYAMTTVLLGILPMLTIYVGKLVLDAVVNIVQTGVGSTNFNILLHVLVIQFIILIVSRLLERGNEYLSYVMGRRLSLNMEIDILRKSSKLDFAFFEQPWFYDMMDRARRESSDRPMVLMVKVSTIIRFSITFASMGGVILTLSPFLFVVMVVVGLPLLFIQLKYSQKSYAMQYDRTEHMRMARYVSGIMTTRETLPEILSFGMWEHLFEKWYAAMQMFFHQDVCFHRKRITLETIAGTLLTGSTVGATGYILYIGITKILPLTVGDMMMYSGAFAEGLSHFRTALDGVAGVYEDTLFLHNLVEFNKIEPYFQNQQKGKSVPIIVESIEFKDVSFKYPMSQQYVLRNVNVEFNNRESTLIVGANGAGKTTLLKLLMRLYEPTEGQILLNGVNIREFDIESLRQNIGIIFQDFVRYAFSTKENIGCRNISDIKDTEQVIAAAKRAKADTFIERFPKRYDTILSKLFKNGIELSHGQWQRICLARLFMKDAPVLILDEPTASVDIETESHLLKEIFQLSKDKICILVSHRMFHQAIVDRVIVLVDGEFVEVGTLEDLVIRNGEFARLWKLCHNNLLGEQAALTSRR